MTSTNTMKTKKDRASIEDKVSIEILEGKIRSLELENKTLKSQLEHQQKINQILKEQNSKLSRYEKGLTVLRRWSDEQYDEFLQDLLDLIED